MTTMVVSGYVIFLCNWLFLENHKFTNFQFTSHNFNWHMFKDRVTHMFSMYSA